MVDFNNLPRVHDPQKIEKDIYEWWESQGYFRPEKQKELGLVEKNGPRFCITLPPPNVTGILHLGQAIVLTLEDLMTRYERMKQKQTLFLPGTDHAGIATQNVVERELAKKGVYRKEIGRKKFLEEVWNWTNKNQNIILGQSKSMGASCDWTRNRFTLDEKYHKAVITAFKLLYDKGLIYRGEYMVNWCPGNCESAISNLETEAEEHESHLWYLKYPIITDEWKKPKAEWASGKWAEGATEFIILATTRPETLLGDTGVAIVPKHPEYSKYQGKTAVLPVLGREIPVFKDSYVDPEFGTGALKVTPAHDPHDKEIGFKHNLEAITVIDETGRMVPKYSGKYANMDRFECRDEIVKDLEKEGLIEKIEPYTHTIIHCQRCNSVIEPRISTQWFIRTRTLAREAMDVVRSGLTRMIPEREERRFYQWMENIQDWCISRQLWWGHQIPVWYCSKGHQVCEPEKPKQCPKCKDKNLKQDEDVLDTWFSSGLWPFATLGWPDLESEDFKRYYPNDMRETGYDILFFWVAREMMLGLELTKQSPYQMVYLHGIIRNERGKKISKSMENIEQYDPLNIIEKYGADPLRFTFIANTVPGKDLNLGEGLLKASKNFCNKIWQSTHYILGNLDKADKIERFTTSYPKEKLKTGDHWILSRLNQMVKKVNHYFEEYDYLNASREMRSFFWDEFCDWYIEISKIRIYDENERDKNTPIAILIHVLEISLRLLHPIIPFLTEALWQTLPDNIKDGPALIVAKWPEPEESLINNIFDENFNLITELIHEIRRVRKEFNVKPGLTIPIIIQAGDKRELVENNASEIITLSHIDQNQFKLDEVDVPKHSAQIIIQGIICYLPLEEIIDLKMETERISKQLKLIKEKIQKSEKKLSGPFAMRANSEIVQIEWENLDELKERKKILEDQLDILR
ncbi:MAG: valine--tRNA ligase [Candidatus Hermodarchaeota archaeon]